MRLSQLLRLLWAAPWSLLGLLVGAAMLGRNAALLNALRSHDQISVRQ